MCCHRVAEPQSLTCPTDSNHESPISLVGHLNPMTGVLSLAFKGILPLSLLEVSSRLCRRPSHFKGSSYSSSAWGVGSTPHTPLFLAWATSMDHGGGDSMATGFLQHGGGGETFCHCHVQSVLWAEFWQQTQPTPSSAWQWVKEPPSSGPWGPVSPPTASCPENHTPVSDR